jgi:2-iminobutanoate/2-iminopropanoate deaminase
MPRRVISVPGLGHGAQPIPQAVEKDGLLVTGGISSTDPATGNRPADLEDEVRQVYANIRAILDAAGFSAEDVVKVTFFVADAATRPLLNPGWIALFPDPESRPARHTLRQELSAGQRVQAELLAIRTP